MATTPPDAPMLAFIETPGTEAPTVRDQALIVLTDDQAFDAFYERMKAETDKHEPDVTTDKGRKAVIALARRVTTTKTAITAAAKGLTEAWRDQTNKVNAARRPIEERLAALADEVRRPVTEWEAAEAARVERNRVRIQAIRDAGIVREDDTAASVEARGRETWALSPSEDFYAAETEAFAAAKDATVKVLVVARDRLQQEEADRAELARLRQEAAERAEREAAEQAERDRVAAVERAEREAREAEEARQRDEEVAKQREADRIAEAERAAEQRARDEAERQAQAERDKVQREHDCELAEARQRAEDAEQARLAELHQQKVAEAARRQAVFDAQAERERIAAEDARRAKNRAHVASVMSGAKVAIMSCGVTEDQAKAIVTAIKGDLIPSVRIVF